VKSPLINNSAFIIHNSAFQIGATKIADLRLRTRNFRPSTFDFRLNAR